MSLGEETSLSELLFQSLSKAKSELCLMSLAAFLITCWDIDTSTHVVLWTSIICLVVIFHHTDFFFFALLSHLNVQKNFNVHVQSCHVTKSGLQTRQMLNWTPLYTCYRSAAAVRIMKKQAHRITDVLRVRGDFLMKDRPLKWGIEDGDWAWGRGWGGEKMQWWGKLAAGRLK